MITFGEVLLAFFFAIIFAGVMVLANVIQLHFYLKEKYQLWWTPKRHLILFVATTLAFGLLMLFGYYANN